jgi:tetratricopeptide (TPR) repeat protein
LALLVLSLACATATAASRRYSKAREIELRGNYIDAIALYKEDGGTASYEGVARCYIALGDFDNAELTYEQLVLETQEPTVHCDYAELLLKNGKYDKLKEVLDKLLASSDTLAAKRANSINASYSNATEWMQQPTPHEFSNLSSINTCYAEFCAIITSPQKMIFCTDRPMPPYDCTNGRTAAAAAAYVIPFTIDVTNTNDTLSWALGYRLADKSRAFSIGNANLGPFNLARTDTELLFFSRTTSKGTTQRVRLGSETLRLMTPNTAIYYALAGANNVTPFEHNKPEKYSVMHPALSNDGNTLYFASDMPGGYGGLDIWYSKKENIDKWSAPENMGPTINTAGNEEFPTCGLDSTILYFSSDGLPGMGGLDIFSTKKQDDGSWATPVNMRYPVNSSADDYYYLVEILRTSSNMVDTIGYLTSNRPGGAGDFDLYHFRIPGRQFVLAPDTTPVNLMTAPAVDTTPADTVVVSPTVVDTTTVVDTARAPQPLQWSTLSGKVAVENTMQPLNEVTVCAIHSSTGKLDCVRCADDGSYAFYLNKNERYIIWGYTEKYQFPDSIQLPVDHDTVLHTVLMVPNPITDSVEAAQYITLSGVVTDADSHQPVATAKICATQNAIKTSECKQCKDDGTFAFTVRRNEEYTISGFRGGYQSTSPIRMMADADTLFAIELHQRDTVVQSAADVLTRAGLTRRNFAREYRIQILANRKETDWEYFQTLRSRYPQYEATLEHTKRNGVTRFTYGSFFTAAEARRYLRLFRNLGYSDSFIAVFEYGHQVESIYQSGSRNVIRGKK